MLAILSKLSEIEEQSSLFPDSESETTGQLLFEKGVHSRVVGEFWTAKQRQGNSLHEVAYRACFKAQLPQFFISKLTKPGANVYDPFSGRGTTVIEAALLGRNAIANDISPISRILSEGRLVTPSLPEIKDRLSKIELSHDAKADIDLEMFFHPETLSEILSFKEYFISKRENGDLDDIDKWLRMVATNRLTGHSVGYFSVYTLPPNQAVSPERQIIINEKYNQKPEYRNTKEVIYKKSKSLLSQLSNNDLQNIKESKIQFITGDARETKGIEEETVDLTVTSPPFLDVVQYAKDNWLRCWFNGFDANKIEKEITMSKTVAEWSAVMQEVFIELFRITKKGGWVAFEVGEVKNGKIKLEDHVLPLGEKAGFNCDCVIINEQQFTKTANIWGVSNNSKGTNSNRIVVFQKP